MMLKGGPYAGHDYNIKTGSTMVFTARGMTGFYTHAGVWHNVGNVKQLRPASVREGTDRTTEGSIGQP